MVQLESSANIAQDSAQAGAAIYNPFVLFSYDFVVLALSNTLAWRCPSRHILAFYNKHISAKHMDIGVGTGYFLDKCQFQSDKPEITLVDLNPNSLSVTAKRLARYVPKTYVANVLEPLTIPDSGFGSIALAYLLHCLPGTMRDKAVVFQNIKPYLAPNGVVFGTTILGQEIKPNFLAKGLMNIYNKKAVFSNREDSLTALKGILQANFSNYSVEIRGCVALFTGRL